MSPAQLAAAGAALAGLAAVRQLQLALAAGSRAGAATPLLSSALGSGSLRVAGRSAHLLVGVGAGLVAGWLLGAAPAVIVGGLAYGASVARARRALNGARRARERGTPLFARSLADALRGGLSLRSALAEVAVDRSVPAALREQLVILSTDVRRGGPLREALRRLADKGGPALRLTCGTVALHVESGGTLAAELQRMALRAEAAQRVDEERHAATAQARATVKVVAALPVIALLGAEVASGDFLQRIAGKPIALALLCVGLALEVVAAVAARAIVEGRR